MKVLLYGINYAPELTGIGKYSGDMGAWLAAQGHDVQVVTAFPYYPNWSIQPPYFGKWWKREERSEGESLIRCPLYVPKQPSTLKRILHEFSFLLTSSFALLACLFQRIDVLVCVVTPFHLGVPARLFAWLKGAKMVYHIQDLQVDAARDLGMLQNKWLLKMMTKTEQWILKKADLVSSISAGMIRKIAAKGISEDKICFFPNWVNTDFIRPLPLHHSLRAELGFSQTDRIVLYSGNLGEKQGLDMLINVAQQMQNINALQFVIVGEGGAKAQLIAMTETYELQNVHFFPLQAFEKLPALLAMADVHLVLQKKTAADLVMPSKLTTILAAGGCTIVTAEEGSTLYEITHKHQFGILIEPESETALCTGIIQALESNRNVYQSNARIYAERFLDKECVLREFEGKLKKLIEPEQSVERPKLSIR